MIWLRRERELKLKVRTLKCPLILFPRCIPITLDSEQVVRQRPVLEHAHERRSRGEHPPHLLGATAARGGAVGAPDRETAQGAPNREARNREGADVAEKR